MIKVVQEGFEFPIAKFNDYYKSPCYIKLSSIVEPRCIWLGTTSFPMHLSLEQVSELLPILQRFVERGDINENKASGLSSFE